MARVDITIDHSGCRMTVTDGVGSQDVPMSSDSLGVALRCGPDVALALLADAAEGHGLDILQAASMRRDEVRLDGREVNGAVLRWALARPKTGRDAPH